MVYMGARWRAPKKNDKKSWKRVANGDPLWDDRAIARKAIAQAEKIARAIARAKAKRRQKKLDLSQQM